MGQPVITIFCSFTRRWAVDRWLENLAEVQHDPAMTNLCILVDCDEIYIVNMVKKFAEQRNYRNFVYKMNPDNHPNEVRLGIRRQRVADVKNQSKDLIIQCDGDIIIGLEDDTVFDRLHNFEQLYGRLLQTDNDVAFVEGVQMGRWGANMIGVWEADVPATPDRIQTLLPPQDSQTLPDNPFQEITGGGFYGYATFRDLYLNHEYYTSSAQPWGPDVNYGFWLHQQGYKVLVNWEVMFGHNDHGSVLYPDALPPRQRLVQVIFNKDRLTGKWNRTDHEPTRY